MRIAYHTDTREIGGAEQNLVDMARIALDQGHDVLLFVPQIELAGWLARQVPAADVRHVGSDRYHDASSPAHRLRGLAQQARVLGSELRRARADLLHVNNGGFPGSDLCRIAPLAARLAGVPRRVMTVHSNPWPRERYADARIQRLADAVVWPNVEAVLCPSQAVADGLRERRGAPARLLRLVHYGVSEPGIDDREAADLRERLAPGDELLVGMVSARPRREKGYDVFVEALAECPEDVRGVLVGPIPEWLPERLRELGLEGRLTLAGEIRPVGSAYRAMDIVVVPSTDEECMPLVILEAMAAGRAVFGSRLSGIPEAIDDGVTGRTFPRADAPALAELLRAAAADRPALDRMGTLGRERWHALFTPDVMAEALERIYDRGAA